MASAIMTVASVRSSAPDVTALNFTPLLRPALSGGSGTREGGWVDHPRGSAATRHARNPQLGYARRRRRAPANRLAAPSPNKARAANSIGSDAAPVKGSGPPAAVDDTPPIELVGADEPVPPTELLVVSRVVVVTPEVVVVGLTVVVVAPDVVVVAPDVVVVGLTVVVVAPLVVVPPEVVAEASWPTLIPASTIMATTISQAAVRLRSFLSCLAIDSYLLLRDDLLIARRLQDKQTAASCRFLGLVGGTAPARNAWPGRGGC